MCVLAELTDCSLWSQDGQGSPLINRRHTLNTQRQVSDDVIYYQEGSLLQRRDCTTAISPAEGDGCAALGCRQDAAQPFPRQGLKRQPLAVGFFLLLCESQELNAGLSAGPFPC